MRIGIYGGSFDPLHIGHVAMASYVAQFGGVDEVWLMVSPENPLKSGMHFTPGTLRLEMAQLPFQPDDVVKVSDFEFSLPRPSYSLATLEALAENYPEHEFVLVIGADNWDSFPRWRSPEEIICKYGLIIYPRHGYEVAGPLPEKVTYLADAPLMEVSSTFIRTNIEAGRDMSHFMPDSVAAYVSAHRLYTKNSKISEL